MDGEVYGERFPNSLSAWPVVCPRLADFDVNRRNGSAVFLLCKQVRSFKNDDEKGVIHLNNNEKLLEAYGWNTNWEQLMERELEGLETAGKVLIPARVTAQYSKQYRIVTGEGELTAAVTGKYAYAAVSRSQFPAVGDWVLAEQLPGESRAVIHALLPRASHMSRREAGSVPDEQVIAANMDTVFIVNALNQDFNLRKIERYLIAVWESGAQPVVVLTKADLCTDPDELVSEVAMSAPGVPVHAVSSLAGKGIETISPYLQPGRTVAITGSSGAGKSTLLNWLSGQELQRVQGVREDDARGRHTTTHRELFVLPGGAVMVDTPGMRELQLWDSADGWGEAFSDIESLAAQCRFHDCSHRSEPGCAVRAALDEGTLDEGRYVNYKKTQRELAFQKRKENAAVKRHAGAGKARTSKAVKGRRSEGFSYDSGSEGYR